MRHLLIAATVFVVGAGPALAATDWMPASPTGARPGNVIGTDSSLPRGNTASNIDAMDTHDVIAPNLPVPADVYGVRGYLRTAQSALQQDQTGLAQNALEMAETRILDRSVPQGQGGVPDQVPAIRHIDHALRALARNDIATATQATQRALYAVSAV